MNLQPLCLIGAETDWCRNGLKDTGAETELPVIGSVYRHCDVTKLTVTSQNDLNKIPDIHFNLNLKTTDHDLCSPGADLLVYN